MDREARIELTEDTIHAKFLQIRQHLDRLESMLHKECRLRKKTQKELKEMKELKNEEERKRRKSEQNMQQLVAILKSSTAKCDDIVEESMAPTQSIDLYKDTNKSNKRRNNSSKKSF